MKPVRWAGDPPGNAHGKTSDYPATTSSEHSMTGSDDNAQKPPPDSDGGGASKRGGWFGGRQREEDARAEETINDRLRGLSESDGQFGPDGPTPEPEAGEAYILQGYLTFTQGRREGDQLSLAGRSVVLDIEANEAEERSRTPVIATIWAQGEHFMVRHSGGIRIGGTRPTLPIIVLEDGDELEWGAHRLEFRAGPAPRDAAADAAAEADARLAGDKQAPDLNFLPPSEDDLRFRDRLRRRSSE